MEPDQITKALARLQQARPSLFGADHHGFVLNPPLSEERVNAFEQKFSIQLPADYREFISSIGNGGAGPFYGIFPLGTVDDEFSLRQWGMDDNLVGDLTKPFPHEKEWNDLAGMPSEELSSTNSSEYDRLTAEFENIYWSTQQVNGAIPICHEGCAIRIWLVVTSPQTGRLWEDRRSEYQGLRPLQLVDGSPATFRGWYTEWLQHALATSGGT